MESYLVHYRKKKLDYLSFIIHIISIAVEGLIGTLVNLLRMVRVNQHHFFLQIFALKLPGS